MSFVVTHSPFHRRSVEEEGGWANTQAGKRLVIDK